MTSQNKKVTPSVEDLRGFHFFGGLDDQQLAAVAALAHLEQVPAGVTLFHEEDAVDAVRIIRTGRVTLSIQIPGQPDAVVSTLSKGQLLGFSALLPGSRWSASARSLKECSLIVLPAPGIHALGEADHSIGIHLMRNALRSATQRLRDARLQLLDIFGQSSTPSTGVL